VWLHGRDKSKGYPQAIAEAALAGLQSDLETGAVVPVPAGWPDVHRLAETISKRHTMTGGHRSLGMLHVATALHLGAREFLTFDTNQRKLAAAEKLKVKP
jgi:predicted nucleic acid-binding protein